MAKKKTSGSPAPTDTTVQSTAAPATKRRRAAAATPQSTAQPAIAEPSTADDRTDATLGSSATSSLGSNGGPTYDQIAEAAYQRYLRRGGTDGRDFDDWLEAEQELKSK